MNLERPDRGPLTSEFQGSNSAPAFPAFLRHTVSDLADIRI